MTRLHALRAAPARCVTTMTMLAVLLPAALAAQIRQGLPADVFASANVVLPDQLYSAGLVEKPVLFTANTVVMIARKGNPDHLHGVYSLENPGLKIVMGAPGVAVGRAFLRLRDSLVPRYGEMVCGGYWFAPERLALQALITESQQNVTGTVRLKLYKGNILCAGRKSPVSLYNPHIATMEADPTKAYNQDDATGFIRLNALRLKVAAKVHKKK